MAEKTTHEEILDLLASKKITLEDAMNMLDTSKGEASAEDAPVDAVLKAEEAEVISEPGLIKIVNDDIAPSAPPAPAAPKSSNGQKPGWLRINIRELDSGRNRVTVNLPIGLVKFGLNVAKHFGAESDEIDLNELADQIKDAEPGVLIDVQDEDSNEHVQISLA